MHHRAAGHKLAHQAARKGLAGVLRCHFAKLLTASSDSVRTVAVHIRKNCAPDLLTAGKNTHFSSLSAGTRSTGIQRDAARGIWRRGARRDTAGVIFWP